MKYFIFSLLFVFPLSEGISQVPKNAKLVNVNGTDIYYEVYGEGSPLFLLHGYTFSSKYWLPYVSDYENQFEVYLVDLTGHGKSSQFQETLSIRSVAEDLNALINYLELDQIQGIGYSYGGDVLFHLSLINPNVLKSMVSIGALGSWDIREFPDWLEFFSYENVDNLPWIHAYQNSEKQIQSILDQMVNYIVNISDEELKSIKAKTLLIFGDDDDSIPLEEINRVRKFLPDSDLWIVPNSGHNAHEGKNKKDFVRISKEFLMDKKTVN